MLHYISFLKGIRQETAAADSYESDPEELCCLPQTKELAVVETFHKGQLEAYKCNNTIVHLCVF